jgi:hypothetical protein
MINLGITANNITEVIQSVPVIFRESVDAISIHAFPGEYHGTLHLAVHLQGVKGISLLGYADLRAQGVGISGFDGIPDIQFSLLGTTDIAREIIALNTSGLVGKINAARFDTQDVKARLTYGYPSWVIKPNHLRSLTFWENGKVTFSQSALGITGIKTGEIGEVEAMMLKLALSELKAKVL